MYPLTTQSTIFLQSTLTEEPNSDPFWFGGDVSPAFREETPRLFEGPATSLEGSPAVPTNQPLPLSDVDRLGLLPSTASEEHERVNFVDFTSDAYTMSFLNQSDDLYASFSDLSSSLSTTVTDCTSSLIV